MTPASTYRLQLHREFTLHDAAALVPYLARLGVGAVYLAPVWRSTPGSTHGYDVLDPNEIDGELGGRAAFDALIVAARGAGLGVVVDFVPNHQAADPRNPRWRELLTGGAESPVASYFDVDWGGNDDVPPGKVLLPVLGEPLDESVRDGTVQLVADDGSVELDHAGTRYPVRGDLGRRDVTGVDFTRVVDEQAYVLAPWRAARGSRNYRRFFDVDGLVGVRVEDAAVFAASHALLLALARAGAIDGIRLDHVDGLADPGAYLEQLADALPDDTWVVVEKILAAGEALRPWPIAGTTGYEWGAAIHAVQLSTVGRGRLVEAASADGIETRFATIERECKALVLDELFDAEWRALLRRVPPGLHDALRALTLELPVYRTYLTPPALVDDADLAVLRATADHAAAHGADRAALDAMIERLAADPDLARRWQQLSGPVMAKGHEDTACYRWPVLVSQCEVGADPDDDGRGALDALHARAQADVGRRAHGLAATATHDTKRGEDVRARLAALSECADDFVAALHRWRSTGTAVAALPADEQWFVAQTLIGAWPLTADDDGDFAERLAPYFRKALREAKLRSSWLDPDEAHERAVIDVAQQALAPASAFRNAFAGLRARVDVGGAVNSLAQLVLKCVVPAAPDVYRGCEGWDLSLVDPDNRRPVHHERLAAQLEATDARTDWSAWRRAWRDGAIKVAVTARTLRLRREVGALFEHGDHQAVRATGAHAGHVVALRRRHGAMTVVAIVARHPVALAPGDWPIGAAWADTTVEIDRARAVDVLTGASHDGDRLALRDLCRDLPVALLVAR